MSNMNKGTRSTFVMGATAIVLASLGLASCSSGTHDPAPIESSSVSAPVESPSHEPTDSVTDGKEESKENRENKKSDAPQSNSDKADKQNSSSHLDRPYGVLGQAPTTSQQPSGSQTHQSSRKNANQTGKTTSRPAQSVTTPRPTQSVATVNKTAPVVTRPIPGGSVIAPQVTPPTTKPTTPSAPKAETQESEAMARAKSNATASLVVLNSARSHLEEVENTLTTAKAKLVKAQAQADSAKARLEEVKRSAILGNEKAAQEVESAKSRLQDAIFALENIEQARAEAEALLTQVQREYDAAVALTKVSVGALNVEKAKLEQIQALVNEAEANHASAQAAATTARQNLDRAQSNLKQAQERFVRAGEKVEQVKQDVPTSQSAKPFDWESAPQAERERMVGAMIGERINAWRVAQGVAPLKTSDLLSSESKVWSQYILDESTPGTWDGIQHARGSGKGNPNGVVDHGFSGEIITGTAGAQSPALLVDPRDRSKTIRMTDYAKTAEHAVASWEMSPAHRDLMIRDGWTTMSVGYAEKEINGFWYAFATARFYYDIGSLDLNKPEEYNMYFLSGTKESTGLDVTSDLVPDNKLQATLETEAGKPTTNEWGVVDQVENNGVHNLTGYVSYEPSQKDIDEHNKKVAQAEAEKDSAEADVHNRKKDVNTAESEVKLANQKTEETQATLNEQQGELHKQESIVNEAQSEVNKNQKAEQKASESVVSAQQRIDDLSNPQEAVNEAQRDVEVAEANIPIVKAEGEAQVSHAESEVIRAETILTETQVEVVTAQEAVEPAREAIAKAEENYEASQAIVADVAEREANGEAVPVEDVIETEGAN